MAEDPKLADELKKMEYEPLLPIDCTRRRGTCRACLAQLHVLPRRTLSASHYDTTPFLI
jgi:hypothetical protein